MNADQKSPLPYTTASYAGAPLARQAMAYVLAGGRGSRLLELTDIRAKPAVYFGGKLRIIDFALSNAVNSGIRHVAVATQYKAHSLIRHMQRGWNFFRQERNETFDILPASQRISEDKWYLGTADAVYQNIDIIQSVGPKYIVLLAGDHVYKMDYEPMLQQHVEAGADVTVACLEVARAEASSFGIMDVDVDDRIVGFQEKPKHPKTLLGKPDRCMASMGIYVFESRVLFDLLRQDAADPTSKHDFGGDVIPRLVAAGRAVAHPFERSCVRSANQSVPYWRDVGTLDAYFDANIDLTDIVPALDLFDRSWPIGTVGDMTAPAKFVHDIDGRRGMAVSSVVAGGCIVSGATVQRSLLFTGVNVRSYSSVSQAVLLPSVDIGRRSRLTKVIVDRGVRIPDGTVVGEDAKEDARRFRRTDSGVCLVTQSMIDRL